MNGQKQSSVQQIGGRDDSRLHQEMLDGVPLSYEDEEAGDFLRTESYADGYFVAGTKINGHEIGTSTRLEMIGGEGEVKPVIFAGYLNAWDNIVEVKSAQIPIFDFFALAESVVSRDFAKGDEAVHQILKYEAPDIIGRLKEMDTPYNTARRMLEYGLLESDLWERSTRGMEVAILNPSISTLKRVINVRGEVPVFYTHLGRISDEYWDEIKKVMLQNNYLRRPSRVPFEDLPTNLSYYLGFSGGIESKRQLGNFFGFELNPHHPDALNGMMSGVSQRNGVTKIEYAKTTHMRIEPYDDLPNYNRYYGDVVVPRIVKKRRGGEEAFNFISSNKIDDFVSKEAILHEADVLCGGAYFQHPIVRQEFYQGRTYSIDTQNQVVDVHGTESYDNRRQQLENLPWQIASPVHDTRRSSIGFLRYRTSVVSTGYHRLEEVMQQDQLSVEIKRYPLLYGQMRGGKFFHTQREGATAVKIPGKEIAMLDAQQFPTRRGEYAQMMDDTIVIATESNSPHAVNAVKWEGFVPFNCVSKINGVWYTLYTCRIDVDFKSNFTLAQVFKAYERHIGSHLKRAAMIIHGKIPRGLGQMEQESFDQMWTDKLVANYNEELAVR
jgi:hypothetical protein